MDTEVDTHAISPSYTPAAAVALRSLNESPTMSPIDSSDTHKEDQSDYTRWTLRNKEPMQRRFYPHDIGLLAKLFSVGKAEKWGEKGKEIGRWRSRWNVTHVQGIQEATNLQWVPKRLHDTRTGQVCATSGMGGAFEYVTVSHVWELTDGVDWSELSRRIGEELSVPYVWVDKTCINQTNEVEKGQEIKKMADYYSSAKHNVIFFSNFSMAAAVNAWKEEGMAVCTLAHINVAKLVGKLMWHRYFARVWTMQEQELARHNVLLMEDGWVDGHDLDNLLRSVQVIHFPPNWGGLEDMFCNCQRRKSLTNRQWQMSVREPLVDVWRRAQGRKCTNPKDIVWGMISLVKGGDRLKATYDDALSDVLTELLALENCLGEVLTIRDGTSGSQDDHGPCWSPKPTGEVPKIMAAEVYRSGSVRNVQFTLEKGALEASAYLLEQWHAGRGFKPIIGGKQLAIWPSSIPWRQLNRTWFVPIWQWRGYTEGVILEDWNSEGNKIHKAMTLAAVRLSTTALALATATTVLIGGT